ncbi:MAG: hypothetical protein ACJATA_000143 [Sphingobacteriales bacterium]
MVKKVFPLLLLLFVWLLPKNIMGQTGVLRNLNPDWEFYVIIIMFGLAAIIRTGFFKRVEEIVKALLNGRLFNQTVRTEVGFFQRSTLIFVMLYLLSSSFFLYQITEHLDADVFVNGFYKFLTFFVLFFVFYLAKLFLAILIGVVFNVSKLVKGYLLATFFSFTAAGLLLVPVNLFMAYTPEFIDNFVLYFGLSVVIVALILRYFRTFSYCRNSSSVPNIYFILYICTFEVMPFALLFKELNT